MLHTLSLRKAIKTVIFLLACLLMTGCYSLKTVPVNSIPAEREILVIHAENDYWNVDSCSISDGILTARICSDDVKIRKGNSAHVYAAPNSAVTVNGAYLAVPVVNIAKTDYQDFNLGESAGFIVIWASLLFTFLLFLG
jgi:hypothetical protein